MGFEYLKYPLPQIQCPVHLGSIFGINTTLQDNGKTLEPFVVSTFEIRERAHNQPGIYEPHASALGGQFRHDHSVLLYSGESNMQLWKTTKPCHLKQTAFAFQEMLKAVYNKGILLIRRH